MGTPSDEAAPRSLYFGRWKIDGSEVFLETDLSYAFVNLKPVVPGHVLISSKEVVSRFGDLRAEQVDDMWRLAHRIGPKLEVMHDAQSLTLVIQDGPDAGQTVPHVHIHVMPRKKGDFQRNDDIYDELDRNDHSSRERVDSKQKARTPEEMAAEANVLRSLFQSQ